MMLNKRRVVDFAGFLNDEPWLERDFWAAEMFVANRDDVPIWKVVGLALCCGHQHGRGNGRGNGRGTTAIPSISIPPWADGRTITDGTKWRCALQRVP